jgi:hypothetical protein
MRVFVSHGARDSWLAKQIARCIGELGVDTFLDAYDIETGDDIESRIWKGLSVSDELLVLLTPMSDRRGWVWMEIGAARASGKRVSAVLYGITVDDLEREHGAGPLVRQLARHLNDIDSYFDELKRRR